MGAGSGGTSRARAALIEKFRNVAAQRLKALNQAMLQLERNPRDQAASEEALREIHTLKGEAKLMGFVDVNLASHRTEALMLEASRQGFRMEQGLFDLILTGFDLIGSLLTTDSETRGEIDLEGFVERVEQALASEAPAAEEGPAEATKAQAPAAQPSSDVAARDERPVMLDRRSLDRLTQLVGDLAQYEVARSGVGDRLLEASHRSKQLTQEVRRAIRGLDGDGHRELQLELSELLEQQDRIESEVAASLVLLHDLDFDEQIRLRDLDERIREIRLIPLGTLFDGYPRAVRDLARELGKKVRLQVEGAAVKVDKQIVDQIGEPLLHLVRNAVDHGLETPEDRKAAGKPVEGQLALVAAQIGSRIQIRVQDDGRGLPEESIRKSAVEKGLVEPELAETLSRDQVFDLAFRPGLSTRAEATDISGRGIGLDVVKQRIEPIGGNITVRSLPGEGTTFELDVPVSSAQLDLLLVEIGGTTYGLPVAAVRTVVSLDRRKILSAAGGEAFHWGDEIIPLVPLARLLDDEEEGPLDDEVVVLLIQHGVRRLGLVVPRVVGQHSVVQRKPDPFIGGAALVSGTVMMGGGRLAIVLNVPELAARLAEPFRARPLRADEDERAPWVLVVDDSPITRSLLSDIFAGIGCRLLEAANGREALEVVSSHPPELVLLDLEMPVMDGFEFLEKLRGRQELRDIPVVVISARGSKEDRRRCLKLGADAYIVKSDFRESDLVETARRFLDRRPTGAKGA